MKTLASLLALVLVPALAHAEDVWRWRDAKGTLCYSNRTEVVPADARRVETRLVIEAASLPADGPDLVIDHGAVMEARAPRQEGQVPASRLHRTYTERRLRFDCYAAGVVYAGGWGHPDDITLVGNCLPYRLGPEAWLNGARAELALREHGLDWREVVSMYLAERSTVPPAPRLSSVRDAE